jgi:nucleotide-binding universal stress UspA family protein
MFREILLPVDLSDPNISERRLTDAVALAKTSGARLHVLAVVPDFGMPMVAGFFPEDFERQALAAADKELHEIRQAATSLPRWRCSTSSLTAPSIGKS